MLAQMSMSQALQVSNLTAMGVIRSNLKRLIQNLLCTVLSNGLIKMAQTCFWHVVGRPLALR